MFNIKNSTKEQDCNFVLITCVFEKKQWCSVL